MRIEVVVDVKTTLGEGPLWDVEQERLYWIDSFDGRVFRATADGGEIRSWDVPPKIGSIAIRRDGNGAVVSLARGFHLLDFKSGEVSLVVDPEPDKIDNRLNDGKVDKHGRFIAGSMDTMEEGPNGALYRLDPDFSLHKLDDGIHRLRTALAGVPTARHSISPTPGQARSGPTITISRRAQHPIGAPSSKSIGRAAAQQTMRPSMQRVAFGMRSSTTAGSCATIQPAASIA